MNALSIITNRTLYIPEIEQLLNRINKHIVFVICLLFLEVLD